jgi:sensor c-di-GMP phosphodiesterase-like protein
MITVDTVREAIEEKELFLEYMPTVRLRDGVCAGAEALTRWRRTDGRLVPPSEFIPIVERTPVAGLLTYWVLETVAGELGDWLLRTEDAHVAINTPPELIGRGGMEYAGCRVGLAAVADKLVLEVTERGVPDEIALDAMIHRTGRRRLVRLALDDVGVNDHWAALLQQAPFDIVKLDKSLVDRLEEGEQSSIPLIEQIVRMTRERGIEIIAEGIERPEQAALLRELGIPLGQGWYFSKALRAGEFLAFAQG